MNESRPRRRPSLLLAAVAALALLAAGASCGLSTNDSPEALSRDNLPEELGGTPATAPPVPDGTDQVAVDLWFMSGDPAVLEPIEGRVPRNPTPRIVLESLFSFSNDDLTARQMRSALPPSSFVGEPEVDNGVLLLDLQESFYEGLGSGEGRYAYGQMVLTVADGFSEIEAVRFLLDGEDAAGVVDGAGAVQSNGLVRPSDYANLLADG